MVTALHSISAGAATIVAPRTTSSWPGLATGVLDLLHEAVLVLSRDARPLGMNRAARTLLDEGDGLMLSARGVAAATPAAAAALRRGIERTTLGETLRMQVPRLERAPLSIRVEPHPQRSGEAAAVVFAADTAMSGARGEALAVRFGLTPTEASVAYRLASGAGLERIAHELEISLNTVRGHLKQVFVKTGVHRQAELVAKLLAEP